MAQPAQSISVYVCRSCRHNLRRSDQVRTFSNTARRSKTIPQFNPTSSSEFDAILGDWRKKVFTPNVLAQHHRDLIYKKSRHDILINDPGVTVTLPNDEAVKLEPSQEWDKPNKRKSLVQIARILGSSSDAGLWTNLQPFLEALQDARYKLPHDWLEKLTRKANEQGKQGIIIQCAQAVKKTGVQLSNGAVTRELLIGCHERAADNGFEGETTHKQGQLANRIALMLEDHNHCGNPHLQKPETDMRRDPLVLAVLLEFAAEDAIHLHEGKDASGNVASFVRKLLAIAEEKNIEGSSLPLVGNYARSEPALEDCVILYNAIEMALKVDMKNSLGQRDELDVGLALKRQSKELEQKIKEYEGQVREQAKGKPRRALQMLEKMREVQEKLK